MRTPGIDNLATPRQNFLNQSQIHSWLNCQYQWQLGYERGLRPRRDKPHLKVGSVGHQVMAALLTKQSPEQAADRWKQTMVNATDTWGDDEIEELDRLSEIGYQLAKRAFAKLDVGHQWTTVELDGKPLVEYQFLLPIDIGKFSHFSGTVDWVARNHENQTFLLDHKFRKQMQPSESEEHNLQMAAYQKLLKKVGINAVGSVSHQIRTELPKKPSINKNGSVSRALIVTDWATYVDAVLEQGENPNDYLEMEDKLSQIEFQRMSYAYRSEKEINAIWDHCVKPVATNISELVEMNYTPTRTIRHGSCKQCDFRSYCWEEMRGGDLKFLEQTEYTFAPNTKPVAFQSTIIESDED